MSRDFVVRVQSPDQGCKRIATKPTERTVDFFEKVQKEFGLGDNGWQIYQTRDQSSEISSSRSKTLSSYKVKHGDMLYLYNSASPSSRGDITIPYSSGMDTGGPSTQLQTGQSTQTGVIEDEVDQYLDKQDGRIERPKHEQMCRHGPSGKCFHCVPIEPYDEEYLSKADPPIKFLSFHSYIRKLTGGVDKGKFAKFENLSCKIKSGCKEHLPWPAGICTKCQPNAVTLSRQKFRHVDYVQFENPFLVDQFLNYWRQSANQRIGLMYGRYEPHTAVPLGIKAVVAAIYEPPQDCTQNSVVLLPDPKLNLVKSMAAKLGIRPVGWIFTDLVAKDIKAGTVKHFRGTVDSFFLSAEECIMAADFQNSYTNPCKMSNDGHFGSKFVTVVVTGDAQNQIHFEAYQVSDQCMALVRDDCMVPTIDAPELAYIKESGNEQYVPDVFYKIKDTYGNEVTQIARPLPVEYLLVDMAVAFPVTPSFTFHSDAKNQFPIENRDPIGEMQNFDTFADYTRRFSADNFLEAMTNFHLLFFLANCDMLPLKDHMDSLLDIVRSKDQVLAHQWRKTEEWATVEQLISAHMPTPPISRQVSAMNTQAGGTSAPLPPIRPSQGPGSAAKWTCAHCTFINEMNRDTCEMCTLPR